MLGDERMDSFAEWHHLFKLLDVPKMEAGLEKAHLPPLAR